MCECGVEFRSSPPVSPNVVEDSDSQDPNYEWMDIRVREFFSKYWHPFMLHLFFESVDILADDVPYSIVSLHKYKDSDIVYLSRGCAANNFFYFYSCLITNVHVQFPLDKFMMGVFRILNVTLIQLHFNG